MQKIAPLLLAVTALLAVSQPAFAQWKWKDANGKIQYSDMPPPPGTPAANILQQPPGAPPVQIVTLQNGKPVNTTPPPVAASAPPGKAELDAQAKKKQEQADQLARQKAMEAQLAAEKRKSCASARENLATLESGVPLRTGVGGDFLSDEARSAQIRSMRSILATDCGS